MEQRIERLAHYATQGDKIKNKRLKTALNQFPKQAVSAESLPS